MTEKGMEIVKRQEKLAAERGNWESVWQDIAEFVLPRRADFTVTRARGTRRSRRKVNNTADLANQQLASALNTLLTNPSEKWFFLRTREPELNRTPAVREWLDEVERRMLAVFNAGGGSFHPSAHEMFQDLTAFGTGAMFVNELEPGSARVLFRTYHLAEVFTTEDAFGRVDSVYRRFPMTARQMRQRWPDNLPDHVTKALETEPDREFEVVHATVPRDERDQGRQDAMNKPWASIWVEVKDKAVLSEGGFDSFPWLVPRWSKVSGERYGRGPAWHALDDIKMVNAMAKTTVRAAQKAADPPLLVADDGVVYPANLNPGGLNFGGLDAAGKQRIQTMNLGSRPDIAEAFLERSERTIREAFFIHLLQTPESPVKTATQVLQETEDKARQLSAVVGRLQTEFLAPLIDRVFDIILRGGGFPEPPAELSGQQVDTEFQSPITQAQEASEALGLIRSLETISQFAAFAPEMFDIYDTDAVARRINRINQVSEVLMRTPEEIEAIRERRRQAEQSEEAKEDAERLAGGVQRLAEAGRAASQARNA